MTWNRVSASQITSFQTCQRLWHYKSIAKKKVLPSPAQARGTAIHAEVEHYLKTGEVRESEWKALVKAMVPHLPQPGPRPDLLVEHELGKFPGLLQINDPAERGQFKYSMPTELDVDVVGYIDFVDSVGYSTPHIGDVKTTSDFRYAKSEEELCENTQLIIYAKWAIETNQAERARITHIYGRTRNSPAAMKVSTVVSYEHILEQWRKIVEIIRKMKAASKVENTHLLPPTTTACDDFGGCPFRRDCGFLDANNKGGLVMLQTVKERIEALKAEQAKQIQEQIPVAETIVDTLQNASVGILPPDAPPRDAIPVEESKVEKKTKKSKRNSLGNPYPLPEGMPETGEIKKAVRKFQKEQDVMNSTIRAIDDGVYHSDALTKAREPLVDECSCMLFIDCWPQKGIGTSVKDAVEWIQPAMKAAAEAFQVPDFRLIDYGKSRGALACAIRAYLETEGLPQALYVSSFGPGSDVLIECLTPHASLIIRKMQ